MSADLRRLSLKPAYRTGRDQLVADFYVPCLINSTTYRRAVGYFTSWGLSLAARGTSHLIHGGGRMYLIASPVLDEDDVKAMHRGYSTRVVEAAVARSLSEVQDSLVRDRLGAIEWMIREGALEVAIALPVGSTGAHRAGIYHEKIGIFEDALGNAVGFVGSSNETAGGLVNNFESVQAFWSWDDVHRRVAALQQDFERMWTDQTPGLHVVPFTDVMRDLLRPFALASAPRLGVDDGEPETAEQHVDALIPGPTRPAGLVLASHQSMAVDAWLANKGRGIFAMATGAGKTISALACVESVARRVRGALLLVIVVPYLVLAEQWDGVLAGWRIKPILCAHARARWESDARTAVALLRVERAGFVCLLVTNATFASNSFQSLLKDAPPNSMLVADEVHHLGAQRLRSCLPDRISLRLGLSATPDRKGDSIGSDSLQRYFGDTVATFTLADALSATPAVLCPYDYWPIPVELSVAEAEEYVALSSRIGRLMNQASNEGDPSDALLWLLLQRARLLGSARAKIPALIEAIRHFRHSTQSLVYCGDGRSADESSVEDDGAEETQRQVDAVAVALTEQLGMRVATYTARTLPSDRAIAMRDFAEGRVQVLVAIRCLDEGVDLPDVRRAFILASSSNPRQYVQRRGRVLRRAPGKEFAEIFDFVVVPPGDESAIPEDAQVRRNLRGLVEREFERIADFAATARNAHQARGALTPILQRLKLEHL